MIPELGHFALILALVVAGILGTLPLIGAHRNRLAWVALARPAAGAFALLVTFVQHPQRVLSRDQLLDFARGRGAQPFDRAIDVQVSRLRRKIDDDPREPVLIKTVRGGGYLFAPKVEYG